jgi:hypothetical protein
MCLHFKALIKSVWVQIILFRWGISNSARYMLDMGLEDTELENLFCNAAMQWLDLDRASFE